MNQTPKHIVAACSLITNDVDDILMIYGPKRGWELPGGQIEEGESIIDGAIREALEESGVQIRTGSLVGVYSNLTSKIVIFAFLAKYVSGELTTSPESEMVEWVQRDQVLARITDDTIRDRVGDLLSFNGQITIRSYRRDPYTVVQEDHP